MITEKFGILRGSVLEKGFLKNIYCETCHVKFAVKEILGKRLHARKNFSLVFVTSNNKFYFKVIKFHGS